MNNDTDQDVVYFTKAMINHESGGNPKARGASNEYGLGQWIQPTWEKEAKEVLGHVPKWGTDEMTPEIQKAVLYTMNKKAKDSGLNPAQIAARHNSGSPDGWENKVGVNSYGVKYNVPEYVKKVTDAYHELKGQGPAQEIGGYETQPKFSESKPVEPSTGEEPTTLGGKLKGRAQTASKALGDAAEGKINPASGVLQTAGSLAGGVGDIFSSGLSAITPDFIEKPVTNAIGKGVKGLLNTNIGQSAMSGVQGFTEAHPEAAANIGAVGNIASLVPALKGVGIAKNAAGSLVGKALGKEALSSVIADVAPEASKRALASGIAKRGTVKSFLKGEIKEATDPSVRKIAETVDEFVPGFSKAGTMSEKVRLTHEAVDDIASQLKKEVIEQGQDRIYSFRELNSSLRQIERPTLLVGDMEKVYGKVLDKALEIAEKKGGKISNLFDARKEFDNFISQQFPNLYTSDTLTPMRVAVKNIRNGMNGFIEKNLPSDIAFRKRLLDQSRLLDAIENMSSKAAKEIGTTRISRFGNRHPLMKGLAKKTAGLAATAGAGLLGVAGYDKLKN